MCHCCSVHQTLRLSYFSLVFPDYIHKWQRVSFCLGCYPFSEAHTGANMAQFLIETLASFDLTHRNEVTTTDRASNMINMMTHLPSYYLHAPCINHLIQTAIGVSGKFLLMTHREAGGDTVRQQA